MNFTLSVLLVYNDNVSVLTLWVEFNLLFNVTITDISVIYFRLNILPT